ncbi:small multi-drug export protein [Patescibacteria group bacterium]|nr:small multi-drug export protein [Patescibacteria group bacterium]
MTPEIKTILLAMTPVNELRGTIPFAITMLDLPVLKTFCLAVLGNMIPVFFLLWFWKYLSTKLMKASKRINYFFQWIFKRTYNRFYKKHKVYGDIALILLVAIPLPFTGAWTGTVAAFLFNISYHRALSLISLGVVIAGIIVTLSTMGVVAMIN